VPHVANRAVSLLWFRRDLRLEDNAALAAAAREADALVPVYVHAPAEEGEWAPGAASRWWLHASLKALSQALAARGSRLLVLEESCSSEAIARLARAVGARTVHWNRLYEPHLAARDAMVARALAEAGIEARSYPGHLLLEHASLRSAGNAPYRIYTPFARAAEKALRLPAPLPAPARLPPLPPGLPEGVSVEDLRLRPRIPWDAGLHEIWKPGEAGAHERLEAMRARLSGYAEKRDAPALAATSRLSPHLHFGEISVARTWRAACGTGAGAAAFRRELLWREFASYVLHHYPHTVREPLDRRFARFPWREDAALLAAWQRGRTGIPIVDAGMRELWRTGWMHNRVRMIVASFLTKHLRLSWLAGARWFWDTLVDADLAANTLNWQWVAGCGADAAPYFRIFNPVLQSQKFDSRGEYLARWVPELASLGPAARHAPWQAPPEVLAAARLRLGEDYPLPVADLAAARAEALAAYRALTAR